MMNTVSCLALLSAAGLGYQYFAARQDEKKYSAPGELIDVGGYLLHIHCQGEAKPGVPTVIFESGIFGCSLDWQLVQPKIAQFAQVVSYDRAGYGWSERGPRPRTFEQMARELKVLLTNKGIHPPFIFVGHSLGGPIARYYQTQHPEEVVGIVLVDTVHEDNPPHFSRIFRIVAGVFSHLAHLGVLRCLSKIMPSYSPNPSWTSSRQKAYLASHHIKPKSLATCLDEWDSYNASFQMLREKKKHLNNRPIIVIARGNERPLRPGLSKEKGEKMYQDFLELQKKLLCESHHSELRIAANSSHMIQFDRPEIIIEAVQDILNDWVTRY